MGLKSIKNFDLKKIRSSFWDFLLNKFGAIFMAIFFIAATLGGLIIYKYMYNSDWSDSQKAEYRAQIESSKIPFNESKFSDIIEKINERKELKNNDVTISKDVFGTTK
jgi:hypothetical protein